MLFLLSRLKDSKSQLYFLRFCITRMAHML